jgi:hypothetical protein
VVADEKLILFRSILSVSNLEQYIRITDVLAVPGPPTRRVLRCPPSFLIEFLIIGRVEIFEMIYSALVESAVGISSWENTILFGGVHDSASQSFHCLVFSSTK